MLDNPLKDWTLKDWTLSRIGLSQGLDAQGLDSQGLDNSLRDLARSWVGRAMVRAYGVVWGGTCLRPLPERGINLVAE